jgi:hypothetical protein
MRFDWRDYMLYSNFCRRSLSATTAPHKKAAADCSQVRFNCRRLNIASNLLAAELLATNAPLKRRRPSVRRYVSTAVD